MEKEGFSGGVDEYVENMEREPVMELLLKCHGMRHGEKHASRAAAGGGGLGLRKVKRIGFENSA